MRRTEPSEDSVSLRVITSAMALVGILAACQLAETPPALTVFGIAGTIAGSLVSYRRRNKNNFWIKWLLSAGILVVLGVFVQDVIYRVQSSIADARAPLTNMLIALQALHSFDLPRRRDLNVSALVGLILLASAATLSRDLAFGVYLIAFVSFGAYMLYLDCLSRTSEGALPASQQAPGPPRRQRLTRSAVPAVVLLVPLLSLATFLLLPKLDIGLLRNVRVSISLNVPFLQADGITNPLLSRSRRGDGSLEVHPLAYFGFNETLDLNYRGQLSSEIVLKIASPRGEFWRAMAFDSYDGHRWTMSRPDTTFDRLTFRGSAIPLEPVPSLSVPRRVPVMELNQVFHLEVDQPNLIPAAAVPHLIYFPTNKVQVDNYGALRSPVLMEKDMVYTVFSRVPLYDLDVLRSVPEPRPLARLRIRKQMASYFQLPENLPPNVHDLGLEIAGPDGSWFARAEKINNYLRQHYRYNLDIPPTAETQDTVADFLFHEQAGYCEHFASAFVVLCRTQGIPARLVTGFTPGSYNPFTGLWEVRMRDAHAWAEIFVPSWGWVTFDPTPDGAPPAFQGAAANSAFSYLSERLGKLLAALAHDPALGSLWLALEPWLAGLAEALKWAAFFTVAAWQPAALLILLAAVAALALRSLIPAVKSRRQAASSGSPARDGATREYLGVCRELSRLGIQRHPDTTAAKLLELSRGKLGGADGDNELSQLLSDFVHGYEASRFGGKPVQDGLAELGKKVRSRVRARLRAKSMESGPRILAKRG